MELDFVVEKIKSKLNVDKSFDIVGRDIFIGDKKGYFVFVDGFAKDDVLYYLLENIQKAKPFSNLGDFLAKEIAYIESEIVKDDNEYDKLVLSVLCGMFALVIDGYDEYILIDSRQYPMRSVTESEVEKVIRGAKDSFVETIVFNTALIRRRIRSEKLIFEMEQIGEYSKTDIAISYIDGLVDEKVLEEVKSRIKSINTKAVILGAEYIEDLLFKKKWYNPLPLVKYTERPDVAAAYLSEGHILLIIDTCPVGIVLPITILQFAQHIGDYNVKFINGTIAKIMRFVAIISSVIFIPIFIYLAENTKVFEELSKKGDTPEEMLFSFSVQIIILEIAFLSLQMSSLHIPTQIAPLFAIVGGLLLSDVAIKLGIVNPITLIAMAITVINTYSIPSIEFSDAIRIFRFFMILMTGFFGIVGLLISLIIVIGITYSTEVVKGAKKYTYPIVPFNFNDLKSLLFRENARDMK